MKSRKESNVRTLSQVLQQAAKYTCARSTIPITSCVILTPKNGGIEVTATNLEVEWTAMAQGRLETPCCVRPRLLAPSLKGLDAPCLSYSKGRLSVNGLTLNVDPADNFPPSLSMDGAKDHALPDGWLKQAKWAAQVIRRDDGRPVLTAVQYNPETGTMAAADGFRLRVVGEPQNGGILIPGYAIEALPADVHTLRLAETNARFVGASATVTTHLIAGTFPNILNLIPQELAWTVECATADLSDALEACEPIAADGSGIIRLLATADGLTVNARAEEVGEVNRMIAAKTTGEPKIALNIRYLMDALKGADEQFTFGGNSPSSPVLVTGENRVEVLMPMFVSQW